MMCKRLMTLALALLLLLPVSAAQAAVTRYALIYDGQTGAKSGAAATIERFMLYSSWNCDYLDMWSVTDLSEYDSIVLCIGDGQQLPEGAVRAIRATDADLFVLGGGGLAQVTDHAAYVEGDVMLRCVSESGAANDMLLMDPGLWLLTGEGMQLKSGTAFVDGVPYPLCQRMGRVTHFVWFSADEPLLCALLADCLQLWQWPYEGSPTAYGHYFVLEYAYPFLDPASLMERTEILAQEGVPYGIAVTPIFNNGDYPAMKRFCEVLRYEQSRGTGIIIRVPFVELAQCDLNELIHHMEIAYEGYASYGVFPLAIQAPVAWMQSAKGLEVLRGYRTIFLFETEEDLTAPQLTENIAYVDGHQIIAPAWSDRRAFSASYAQGVYLDAAMPLDELRTQVQRLKDSNRAFKALGGMENAVYSGEFAVLSDVNGGVTVNGKWQDLTYRPFVYEDDYTFDRGFTQYLKDQIETSNQYVMIFVIVSCTVFIIMMILFRRQIRRELLIGKPKRKMKQD